MIRADRRVLVFSAHAADFCSRAGGAILRLVDAGCQVHIYDLTYGEKCESPAVWNDHPGITADEVKTIRRAEIHAAAEILGAPIDCLDFDDSPLLIGPERRMRLLEIIRAFRPDLVLSHWIDDFLHPDHVEAVQAVLWASRYCFRPGIQTEHPPCAAPEVVCFEPIAGASPIVGYIPNLYVDVTTVFERKKEALRKLTTQPELPERYEIIARYRGLEAQMTAWMKQCEFAEAFCRIGTEAAP
jgi:4-oxalomesaconate hydratase